MWRTRSTPETSTVVTDVLVWLSDEAAGPSPHGALAAGNFPCHPAPEDYTAGNIGGGLIHLQ
ncbi:hypothetical protein brsh051_18570 [Brooklawnia propionicigenes]|uniref:Uncharacterized protein n=1 Tax=Brooklawnia propionicigenes TaxID=3041175 RepID=A0AAN0MHR3_9ACTN|nr:hypothetical protein brsh051_18570 [Brooklawnia sp. SH051]